MNRQTWLWAALAALWLAAYSIQFFVIDPPCPDPDDEARMNGLLATGLNAGLLAPPREYQYGPSRGPLVYGALLAPVYCIAGSKFLWIRLLGLLFVAGGVYFWTRVLHRAWGAPFALLFFAFSVLPPPFFQWTSHCGFWGNHLESIFFSGLVFFLFFRLGDRLPAPWRAAALGGVAGFATFFCPQNAPLAPTLAVVAVWRWGRRALWRFVLPAGVVFLLFFRSVDGSSWTELLVNLGRARTWEKIGGLWFSVLPSLMGYNAEFAPFVRNLMTAWRGSLDWQNPYLAIFNIAAVPLLSVLFCGLACWGIVVATLASVRSHVARFATPVEDWLRPTLLVWLFLWTLAYGVSLGRVHPENFNYYGLRYALPLYPVVLSFVCWTVGSMRRGKWLVAAPFLFVGLLHIAVPAVRHWPQFGQARRELTMKRGDDYEFLIRHRLAPCWGRDWPAAAAAIRKLPRAWRDCGWAAAGGELRQADLTKLLRGDPEFAVSPGERRPAVFGAGQKWGRQLFAQTRPPCYVPVETDDDDPECWKLLADADADIAAAFVEGAGAGFLAADLASDRQETTLNCAFGFVAASESGADYPCGPIASVRTTLDRFPRLPACEIYGAFLRGAAAAIGERDASWRDEQVAKFCEFWAASFGIAPPVDAGADFFRGFAAGQAEQVIDRYNWFVYEGDTAQFLRLKDSLRARGVALKPRRVAGEYELTAAQ